MEAKNFTVNISVNGEMDVDKIAQAIRKVIDKVEAKPEPLKVGDYAKVNYIPSHYQNGTIVEIIRTDYCEELPYETKNLDGTIGDIHAATNLVKATDEEVDNAKEKLAQAERKQADSKWAKIGRKPNEFKRGDIVRAPEGNDIAGHSGLFEILEFCEYNAHPIRFINKNGQDDGFSIKAGVKLVTPVEARFDR